MCGPGAGQARVRATATIAGNTGAAFIVISFQPSNDTLPFVSSCSPSFGPKEGGTVLTLNGGRFFGSPSTTRVQFTVNGVTKDGIVQSVSQNQIVVLTPGFPEFSSPGLLAQVTVSLGTNQVPPVVLSLPSCFSYGTQDSGTPQISSLLPSSGTNEGGTRVTIVGSGFSVGGGVQVFFGSLEATVVSVSFNQVVVLSPLQVGQPTPVAVTVRNIASGQVSNGVTYNYTEPMIITGFNNNVQPLGGPFLPMTIFGRGFQAPVAVELAGWAAIIQSVSATEIVVVPGPALTAGCADITGAIEITNLNTGSSVSGRILHVPRREADHLERGSERRAGRNGGLDHRLQPAGHGARRRGEVRLADGSRDLGLVHADHGHGSDLECWRRRPAPARTRPGRCRPPPRST